MQASIEVSAVKKGCTTYDAELTVGMQQELHEDYPTPELCILLRASQAATIKTPRTYACQVSRADAIFSPSSNA